MPIYETSVQSVVQRAVTTRDGRQTTVFDIVDGENRKWSTFRRDIANEANRFIGQQVEITGRISTNDRGYERHDLDDVRAATGAQVRAAEIPLVQSQTAGDPSGHIPRPAVGPTEKDISIARQVAAKVSAHISDGDATAFWANMDPLVTYFLYGFKPPEYASRSDKPAADVAPFVEKARAAQNQFVPAGAYDDPGPEAPSQYSDQDIPF